jgi:predicted Zn-dependent protease
MRNILVSLSRFSLLFLFALSTACAPSRAPVPVGTIPKAKEVSVAEEQYGQKILGTLTKKWKLDYNHPRVPNVRAAVKKLTKAAKADQHTWHVYVLKDDSFKNAAATRGNHVFIWTGMIDATQNDAELAGILGHEIGHVLARHTDPDPNEEMKKMLINVGALAAGVAATAATGDPNLGQTAGQIASQLTNKVGEGLLLNPYSQKKEDEADHIGLFMMADAGYNPQSAIDFWKRAAADPSFGGNGTLAFFSTHPPAADRLQALQALLPQALARYRGESSLLNNVSTAPPPTTNRKTSKKTKAPTTLRRPTRSTPAAVSKPSDDADSWDVRRKAQPATSWRVKTSRAILYLSPSTESKKLGEFPKGALIDSALDEGEWIKISSPESGYLRQADLESASP